MKRNHFGVFVAVLVAITIVGCAKAPTTEFEAAKSALTAAEGAEAAMYAEAEINEARQAVTAVEAELATQEGKFALARKYDKASELIAEAANKAAAAEQSAVAAKAEAMKLAETSVTGVKDAIASLDTMTAHLKACPKKPKGFDADMIVMGTQIDALKAEVTPVEEAVTKGDYKGAIARAEVVKSGATTLGSDLAKASEKIGCPMPEPSVAEPSVAPAN